jgi:predicted lipoprotein with Yx(FWY)xxD motif
LISAGGAPVPWAGTLTTTTIGGKSVLAEPYLSTAGWVSFPLYTFSEDQPYGETALCMVNPACARAWPPVLTSGSPGISGVPASAVGETGETGEVGDITQVTWYGHPLYLFSNEKLAPASNGAPVPAGNGIRAFGGTFSLAANP